MPIYAYRCESCGFQKDALQKLSDAPLTVCPECGLSTFKKQVTAAGFQLKGSGWYVTDFRDGGTKAKPDAANASGKSDKPAAAGDGAPSSDSAKAASASSDKPSGTSSKDSSGASAPAPAAASPSSSSSGSSSGGTASSSGSTSSSSGGSNGTSGGTS